MFLYNTVTGCLPTSAHFSQLPDFDALLIGTRTGEVQVLNAETGAKVSFDAHVPSREPVMQARWRPLTSPRLSSVFAACDVSGAIHWWHVHSRRHLGSVELDDSLLSIDYSPEGATVAACGKARHVTIIDDGTHKPVRTMGAEHGKGHTNRVFAVKYASSNIVVSGGWDNCVLVWDIRTGASVRAIYGPTIGAAQGLDVNEQELLTASNRGPPGQLQLWDLGSGQVIESTTVKCAGAFEPFGCLLGPPVVVVGHSNSVGEARIGDTILTGFDGPCVAVCRDEHRVALVGIDSVRVCDLNFYKTGNSFVTQKRP
eukprot:GEMP01072125.1.p1 GENE.GEMP01072125.1~~GEMP01072125.1.p1  ORF type:complete len:313 (+),score=74.40 GEMP01072125.1:41-979(+)